MTNDDQTAAIRALSALQPGFLPFEIFHQVARLSVLPIVEIVPLRTNAQGATEVLLLPRDPHDPIFPGQLHTPGVVVLATDATGSFQSAFRRILEHELAGVRAGDPAYVTHLLHHSGRGMESAHIHWVELLDEPAIGTFYDVTALPATLMQSQLDFIPLAAAHYQAAH